MVGATGQHPVPCKKISTAKNPHNLPRNTDKHRRRTRQRNKVMNIGTWNILTLLQPGKMNELAEQIEKLNVEVVALQEIRWKDSGIISKKEFSLYYSGPELSTGQAGVGFFVKSALQKNVICFQPYNDRICKLRIKGKYNNMSLISVYAPTEDKDIEFKEEFYEGLQKVLETTPKSDTVVILGDLNAQLGKENTFSTVTGKHTLHDETNGNGEMLCNFAVTNDMTIMSTRFQHKRIHLGTWKLPGQETVNQIDHVVINRQKKDIIVDVRCLRGPNID